MSGGRTPRGPHLPDAGPARTPLKCAQEFLQRSPRPFRVGSDASIPQVHHVASEIEPPRSLQSEVAKPYALNPTRHPHL